MSNSTQQQSSMNRQTKFKFASAASMWFAGICFIVAAIANKNDMTLFLIDMGVAGIANILGVLIAWRAGR